MTGREVDFKGRGKSHTQIDPKQGEKKVKRGKPSIRKDMGGVQVRSRRKILRLVKLRSRKGRSQRRTRASRSPKRLFK